MSRAVRTAGAAIFVAAGMCLATLVPQSSAEDHPAGPAAPATVPAAKADAGKAAADRQQIEVCFVLDTTGSMVGLIEGAKQKIWSIANTIIAVHDKPQIKMALVGYRDRGDLYITKVFDLTDDIDTVFKNLMAFKADGGGDGPESVNQALNEAVTKVGWSEKKEVVRIIFLVGDAPPHMDYKDDVKYTDTIDIARKKDITINAVQCGTQGDTTPVWQEIAKLGKGAYIPLAQEGGMVAIATPFDKELAELNGKVAGTVVAFGDGARQRAVADKVAFATTQPAAVAADRAAFYAKDATAAAPAYAIGNREAGTASRFAHKAIGGDGDLVWACTSGEVKLEELKEDQLPAVMRTMTPEQRKAYIAEQHKARAELQEKITELSKKRDAYVTAEREKMAKDAVSAATAARSGIGGAAAAPAPAAPADSFDAKVSAVVREQAEAKK